MFPRNNTILVSNWYNLNFVKASFLGTRIMGYQKISLPKDGDKISINVEDSSINIHVSEEELAKRKEQWRRPEPNYSTGALAKFASLVGSAANGAITKPAEY